MFTKEIKNQFISVRVLMGQTSSNPNPNQKVQNVPNVVSMSYCVRIKWVEYISKLCLCLLKERKTNLSLYMS